MMDGEVATNPAGYVSIAAAAARSDRLELNALYPALRRFAAVVSASDGDPDDLLQSAVEKLLRLRADIDDPAAYLRRTMVNLESNRRRGLGRLRGALARLSRNSDDADAYPSDLAVLDSLDPVDRSVVFLIDVEGWPSKDVAEQLDLTDSAVRTRATRARTVLREQLSKEDR